MIYKLSLCGCSIPLLTVEEQKLSIKLVIEDTVCSSNTAHREVRVYTKVVRANLLNHC